MSQNTERRCILDRTGFVKELVISDVSLAVSRNENIYRFDDIIVDCENFRVQKNGHEINVTPRAFDVLVFLLKNSGRVVEKQELFDQVWKGTFVGDNALTKVIKEIRHALEDPADQPRYIETVPKRGYRFTGKLDQTEGASKAAARLGDTNARPARQTAMPGLAISKTVLAVSALGLIAVSALVAWLMFRQTPADARPLPIRSIAVLPFKPLNSDSRDESLEVGMAETLITRLSNLKQITVRPMSSVRKYTDEHQDPVRAGREVQAEAVLDGSIQKAGDRIRVTVRLINVNSGAALWSEQFDESFTDIFKVQDAIAERVTTALTLELSRQERDLLAKHSTNSPEAYQLYLRGQLLWHRRRENWIEQSLEYYKQALEKDPNFALAHIGEAECYIMLSGHRKITMQEAEAKARPGIMRALAIDDTSAQAHNALAELKYQYEFDWPGAEVEFKKAVELNPNVAWVRQAYGWFLMSAGRFDEATVEMDKALELDPSSLTINVGRGRLYYYSRQYDQAQQHFQNILAVEPNDWGSINSLYTIYEQKQMYPEALEVFIRLHTLKPETAEEFREAFRASGWKGFVSKHLEKLEKAENYSPSRPSLANAYVRLGDKDKAFFCFEKLFEARDAAILQFKVEPAYDILRDDPRYDQLVRKLGLNP